MGRFHLKKHNCCVFIMLGHPVCRNISECAVETQVSSKKKNWDGAESRTRPSNLPDINLNQSELTRDTYLVRVNPHKSSSNSRK
jgi:hypothetical protein